MRTVIRSGILALTLLSGVSFGLAETAEARGGHSHLSLSVGVGVPFCCGGYYGGYYGPGYYGSAWDPYYPPYYYPAPVYYGRPAYRPYGPVVSLGLFPTYVGDSMTTADRDIYYSAYRRALAAPIGQAMAWNSGNTSGEITTTRDGWSGKRYCREFRQTINVEGRAQEAYGTACQGPNGDWQLVQNQPQAPADPY